MKKLFILSLFIITVSSTYSLGVNIFTGLTTREESIDESMPYFKSKNTVGYNVGAEIEQAFTDTFKIGIGIKKYGDFNNKATSFSDGGVKASIPVYMYTKFGGDGSLYYKLELGKAFQKTNNLPDGAILEDGVYIGLGTGIVVENLFIEALAAVAPFDYTDTLGNKSTYGEGYLSINLGLTF